MAQAEVSESILAKERVYKILSILCLGFITLSVVLLWNRPLLHYQLSPYSGVTPMVWVLLILSFGIASYILISLQEGNQTKGLGRWGTIALVMIILCCAVVLLFPYIRSAWFMGRGDDTMAHVGFLNYKLQTGHEGSPYPPMTDITASLALIANISSFTANASFGIFLNLLSIPFMYCLAKVVFKDKRMIVLASALTAATLLNLPTAKPFSLFPILVPLALVLYLSRSNNISYRICCIVYLLLLVFFHPLGTLMFVAGLIGIELFNYVKNIFTPLPSKSQAIAGLGNPGTLVFFSTTFLAWMTYQNIRYIAFTVTKLRNFFLGDIALAPANMPLFHFSQWGITGFNLLILFFKTYGQHITFIILTLTALILIYKNIRSRIAGGYEHKLFSLSGWFIATGGLFTICLVFIKALDFSVLRLINLSLVLTPLFAAYALYSLLNFLQDRVNGGLKLAGSVLKNNLSIGLIVLIICIPFIFMVFSIYPSPYTSISNQQVMRAEIIGTEWVLSHTNVYATGTTRTKIGTLRERLHEIAPLSWKSPLPVQNFQWYDQISSIGDYPIRPHYLVLTRARILRATEMYIPRDWLTEGDLERFSNDTSINKIYSNSAYFAFWLSP